MTQAAAALISLYALAKVRIEGMAPLIMHNNTLLDPLNPLTKAMKKLTGKRTKTDDDHAKIAEIEFKAGFYGDEKGRPIMPGENIEACIRDGAKKSKKGKVVQAGLFIDDNPLLIFEGPKDIDKLSNSSNNVLTVGVKNKGTGGSVMRTRPIFRDWALEFTIQFRPDLMNADELKEHLIVAGQVSGLGDWRPRHGRFHVAKFDVEGAGAELAQAGD